MSLKKELPLMAAEKNYEGCLAAMVTLRNPVDAFFDKVMVMTENRKLRDNRLALIKETVDLFSAIADFSQIVVEGEKRESCPR